MKATIARRIEALEKSPKFVSVSVTNPGPKARELVESYLRMSPPEREQRLAMAGPLNNDSAAHQRLRERLAQISNRLTQEVRA